MSTCRMSSIVPPWLGVLSRVEVVGKVPELEYYGEANWRIQKALEPGWFRGGILGGAVPEGRRFEPTDRSLLLLLD